jgi:hypothetical protein
MREEFAHKIAVVFPAVDLALHVQVEEYVSTPRSTDVSPIRFEGGGIRQGITGTGAAASLTSEFVASAGRQTILKAIYANNTHSDVVNLTIYRQKASGVVASASDAEKLASIVELAAGAAEPIVTGDLIMEPGDKIIVISDVAAKALLNFQYQEFSASN